MMKLHMSPTPDKSDATNALAAVPTVSHREHVNLINFQTDMGAAMMASTKSPSTWGISVYEEMNTSASRKVNPCV